MINPNQDSFSPATTAQASDLEGEGRSLRRRRRRKEGGGRIGLIGSYYSPCPVQSVPVSQDICEGMPLKTMILVHIVWHFVFEQ